MYSPPPPEPCRKHLEMVLRVDPEKVCGLELKAIKASSFPRVLPHNLEFR